MSNISPKLIDVERCRVDTDDKLKRNITDKDVVGYIDEILYYDVRKEYNEISRFPTQLFTNNKKENFKYVKHIS